MEQWSRMTDELLLIIFRHLDQEDLGNCAQVCRTWNRCWYVPVSLSFGCSKVILLRYIKKKRGPSDALPEGEREKGRGEGIAEKVGRSLTSSGCPKKPVGVFILNFCSSLSSFCLSSDFLSPFSLLPYFRPRCNPELAHLSILVYPSFFFFPVLSPPHTVRTNHYGRECL